MEILEFFEEELNWIKNPVFKDFAIKMVSNFPPYFMEVASSSSGKYHSKWSNCKPLGLAYHTKGVCQVAHQLSDAYGLTDDEHDAVVIASLAHDAVKYGFGGGKHTSKTHEAEGAIFFKRCVKQLNPELPLQGSIYKAIASHQGKWCVSDTPKKFPDDFDLIGQLLHIADMVASRPGIRFDFLETNMIG